LYVVFTILVLSHSNLLRKVNLFGPIPQHLQNFSDIGTLAMVLTGVKNLLVPAISGALLGPGQTFRKYRAVVEILKKAGGNADG